MKKSAVILIAVAVLAGLYITQKSSGNNEKGADTKSVGISTKDHDLEKPILSVTTALQKKDVPTLSSYIDKDKGFYVIDQPGTMERITHLTSFNDAEKPLADYFKGALLPTDQIYHEALPDSEACNWPKTGIYYQANPSDFSDTLLALKAFHQETESGDVASTEETLQSLKALEEKSVMISYLSSASHNDEQFVTVQFYLTPNEQGAYRISAMKLFNLCSA